MGSGAEGARKKEKKTAAGRFRDFFRSLNFILISSSVGFDSCTWYHGASRIIFSELENCVMIDRDLEVFCRGGPLSGRLMLVVKGVLQVVVRIVFGVHTPDVRTAKSSS